jgi:hypothetical protein
MTQHSEDLQVKVFPAHLEPIHSETTRRHVSHEDRGPSPLYDETALSEERGQFKIYRDVLGNLIDAERIR